jgi:hypothetical protein
VQLLLSVNGDAPGSHIVGGVAMNPLAHDVNELEESRWTAMIGADIGRLNTLLSDRLCWTHASGHCDGKAAFLERIASGRVIYLSIERSAERWVHCDGAVVITGTAEMRVVVEGRECELMNRYTNVWVDENDSWRLAAWQSTPASSVHQDWPWTR